MTFKLDPSPTEHGCSRGGLAVLMLQHQQPGRVGTEGSEKTWGEISENEIKRTCLFIRFFPVVLFGLGMSWG